MLDYSWPGPFEPFEHQRITTEFIVRTSGGFVLNEMGLGKSASALWAIDYLLSKKQISKALIVAPMTTLNRVWMDEIFRLLPHRQAVLFYGPAKKRKALYSQTPWEIGVINFEGVHVLKDLLAKDVSDGVLDMIVIDEASAYRNSRTQRWKALRHIVKSVPRVIPMTGTPCPESPADAYGLAKLLDVPGTPRTFSAWRDEVMMQVSKYKWVPRPDGYEKAFKLLQPAVRFTKAECLDLPPLIFESLDAPLSEEQRIAYVQMQKEMQLQFSNGEPLSAINAADKINKLRQIACGVVKDTQTGEYLLLDRSPRVEVVCDIIREAASKAIIVVPFKGIMQALCDDLAAHFSVEYINGDVDLNKRNSIIAAFRTAHDPQVLLVHPKVMAHGLTLTEASTLIFYAPIYSGEETKQIIERINRPGQKNHMTVVRLGATDLEWKIYKLAERKMNLEDALLQMYEQAMNEVLDKSAQ